MIRYAPLLLLACCAPEGSSTREREQRVKNEHAQRAAGLGLPPPEAYLRPEDQERARWYDPNDMPCTIVSERNGYKYVEGTPLDECYRMLPPQRYQGVWVNEFEGSRFYPDWRTVPASRDEARIWLDVERVGLRDLEPNGQAYLVEFEGRRTMYPGLFGHLGEAEHELIADRIISIRKVGPPPPPPPTDAELREEWRQCEAAGTCMKADNFEEVLKERR